MEGNISASDKRIDMQTIYSAMFSIFFFKGFSLMRTTNMNETSMVLCNMVCKLANNLKKGKMPYYMTEKVNVKEGEVKEEEKGEEKGDAIETSATEASAKDYCNVVKKVKKENITAENIGEIMLSQIPGVSATIAKAVLAPFETLPKLIYALKEDPQCLNQLTTTDSHGKSRKISKTAIASIVTYLTN
jgi:ERCC4-type nuclease